MAKADRKLMRRMLTIALPMVVSHASESVMLFVDRLFLSRVGKVPMSAAMSGGIVFFMLCALFIGIVGYTNALVAQYFGADRRPMCARTVTQALLISVGCYPLLLACIPAARFVFTLAGQSPEQVSMANAYLRILLAGAVVVVARSALAGFFVGIGRTRVVMAANIVGMAVNVPANYLLIYGKLGLPALGIRGAALGTLFGSFAAFAILAVAYGLTIRSEDYRHPRRWRFHGDTMKRLLRFGAPAGVESLLNVSAFNVFVQLMHSYGPKVAAAVTITFNWDLLSFVPMLGLGLATTALVGQHLGAGDTEGASKSTYLALRLAYVYAGVLTVLFVAGAVPLVRVFSGGFPDDSGEVARLATTLLRLASLYIMADGVQIVFAGALRGAGDTAWVMRVSMVLHWLLAMAAIVSVRVLHLDPVIVWCLLIAVILSLGVAMVLRFRRGKWKTIKLID